MAEIKTINGYSLCDAAAREQIETLTQAKASGELDGKTAYEYAQDGGYTGTEAEFAAKLAAEIPTVLPNPQKLYIDVFGENEALAQRVSYDGRSTQQITIHNREGVAQYVLGQVPSMITWENMLGKPFGTLGQDAVLFEEQTITLDDGSYQISTNAVLEVGASYVVTLDGAASECEGRLLTIEGGSVPYLGNSRIFGGEDTGEDFVVFTIDGLIILHVYSAPVEATEVTFGLESIASVKRLDEAYLPESALVTGAQELTDEQKAQVRENIGAASGTEIVPSYVYTEADAVARLVNQHQSNDSIVFPFLSDAHCGYYTDTANAAVKLAGQLLDQIGRRVPFDCIVSGGDLSTGAWNSTRDSTFADIEDYTALTREAHRGVPALWAIGNHDDAPYQATADRLTQRETFALFGRKNRVSGAVCPNGCNYGYLDLDNRNLRVICLDTDDKRGWGTVQVTNTNGLTCDFVAAPNVGGQQLKWLAEQALDFTGKADPSKWSIVVVSHAALNLSGSYTDPVDGTVCAANTANAAVILSAYRSGKSGSITHNGVAVSYDFSTPESRAAVICVVHGHDHKFCSETLSGGIVSVGCPNVMNGRERASADGNTYTKTAGTANGTSFCIITIDRENSVIYADCVGAGYDREFEYTTAAAAYTNQLPISTGTDGAVYNGVGYKADTYLSGGAEGTKAGIYATGFIPCAYGDIIRFANCQIQANQSDHRFAFYDANKVMLSNAQFNTTQLAANGGFAEEYGSDGSMTQMTLNWSSLDSLGCAYMRLCCGYLGEDSVITVGEEIA